jgi:hypothetical protein
MFDALALIPRWISVLKDGPELFLALAFLSCAVAWWLRGMVEKSRIERLKEDITKHFNSAQEKEREFAKISLELQSHVDRLATQVVERVPSLEVAATIGALQSSLGRLEAATKDISQATNASISTLMAF